jgi:hypothetical protein
MRPRKGAHLGWSMCRPPPRVELVEGRRRCGCDPDRFPPPSRARQRRRKGRRRRRRKGEPEAARCGRRRADAGGYRHVGRHRRRGLFMLAVRAVVGGFLRLGTPAVAIERLWFGWGQRAWWRSWSQILARLVLLTCGPPRGGELVDGRSKG